MWLLRLGWKSIEHRLLISMLTISSIAVAVALFLSVETIRKTTKESFEGTISKTDLIVGARSGASQLLLYSVFHMGEATQSISTNSYLKYAKHPAVDWAVPLALGDSHRGFRVLATTADFFKHYQFRDSRHLEFKSGETFGKGLQVVIGSEIAKRLSYQVGDKIVLTHGTIVIDDGSFDHSEKPFTVSGVLQATGTPIDQLLLISLESFEEIHSGMNFMPGSLTAFYLGLKTRRDTILLKREIESDKGEPLTAIMPGVALADLWRIIGYVEQALKLMSLLVVFVGLMGILIGLYTTLNERRREMAILRALGVGPSRIFALLVSEAFVLTFLGCVGGVVLEVGLLIALKPWMTEILGMELSIYFWQSVDWTWWLFILLLGSLVGVIPGIKAYRMSLHDGLSIRL